MENRNVVICGVVRTVELFKKSIEDYVIFREKGIVDKIIFTTWIGEVDKYKGLREYLVNKEVLLIESHEPKVKGVSHIWHQMKSLDYGLRELDDDSFVLKTRPDLYVRNEFLERMFIDENYLTLEKQGEPNNIFSMKIWVPWFEITKPFYIADECFFGKVRDIKLLVNYDTSYDVLYDIDAGISHVRRFIHPFVDKYSVLKEYLQFSARTGFALPNRFGIMQYNLESENYLEYLAVYYNMLKTYFRVESTFIPDQITFRKFSSPAVTVNDELFSENFSLEHSWRKESGHIYAYNENWLNGIFENRFKNDEIARKLFQVIELHKYDDFQSDQKRSVKIESYCNRLKEMLMAHSPIKKGGKQKKKYLKSIIRDMYMFPRKLAGTMIEKL